MLCPRAKLPIPALCVALCISQLVCLLPCREVTHLALVKAETLPLSPILIFPPRVVGYFGELLAFSGSQFLHH